MKKELSYTLIGIIVFIGGFIFLITLPASIAEDIEESKKRYNDYFEKVDYEFTGEVRSIYYIDGTRCLLEVEVNEFSFSKNNLNKKDDFVGLYNEKDNIAVLFVNFPDNIYDIKTSDKLINVLFSIGPKKSINTAGIFIKIDSNLRKIYYSQGDNKDTASIFIPNLYSKYLEKKEHEMKDVRRF